MSGKLSLRLNNFIQSHKELSIYLFFALLSVLVLFFYSQDSYLYDLYNRVDSAWFFMCGKAWMNGMVPYVDFADSKGPLLWLIYGLGYLISPRDYTGVYWITCVWYSFTYYFTYKLADIFLKNKRKSILCAILMTIAFFNPLFHVETRAEDFCLLFITISLYRMSLTLYDDDHQDNRSTSLSFLWFGCCFSALLLIKFNYAAMQCLFPFCTAIYLIKDKRNIIRPCLYWIIGAALTVLPFLTYFLIQENFDDFINEYFINTSSTILNLKDYLFQQLLLLYAKKKVLLLLICTIVFNLLITKILDKSKWVLLFCALSFLAINIVLGRVYYYNINSIFLISGVICFLKYTHFKINLNNILLYLIVVILPHTYHVFQPTYDNRFMPFKFKGDTLEERRFNDINGIIAKKESSRIINLFSHEYGYGISSEALPGCKYWAKQNGATQSMIEDQIKAVESLSADFLYIHDKSLLEQHGLTVQQLWDAGYVNCYEHSNVLLFKKTTH